MYCRSGVRSVIASEILDAHNFTKVYNMLGGIQAWQSAGYPVLDATGANMGQDAPFWMQWWFWTIAASGIVVLAVTVYFLKKREPPTREAPTLPAEGAPEYSP